MAEKRSEKKLLVILVVLLVLSLAVDLLSLNVLYNLAEKSGLEGELLEYGGGYSSSYLSSYLLNCGSDKTYDPSWQTCCPAPWNKTIQTGIVYDVKDGKCCGFSLENPRITQTCCKNSDNGDASLYDGVVECCGVMEFDSAKQTCCAGDKGQNPTHIKYPQPGLHCCGLVSSGLPDAIFYDPEYETCCLDPNGKHKIVAGKEIIKDQPCCTTEGGIFDANTDICCFSHPVDIRETSSFDPNDVVATAVSGDGYKCCGTRGVNEDIWDTLDDQEKCCVGSNGYGRVAEGVNPGCCGTTDAVPFFSSGQSCCENKKGWGYTYPRTGYSCCGVMKGTESQDNGGQPLFYLASEYTCTIDTLTGVGTLILKTSTSPPLSSPDSSSSLYVDSPSDYVAAYSFGGQSEVTSEGIQTFGGASFTTLTGAAIALDGVDDYAMVKDSSSLDFGSGDFTVSAWVKKKASSTGGNNKWFVNKWNTRATAGTNEWAIDVSSVGWDDIPQFSIESGYSTYYTRSSTPLTINKWTLLTAVRQGAYIKLYMDGILKGQTYVGNVPVNNVGRNLYFGSSYSGCCKLNGEIDKVMIYKRALTDNEIRDIYYSQGNISIAHWKFDGNANDAVGNNHGTVTGATLTTGVSGQAYYFDGYDYITIANENNFDFERTKNFTVCMWVYPKALASSTTSRTLISKLGSNMVGWELSNWGSGNSGAVTLYLINSWPNNAIQAQANNSLSLNQWQHVCASYDGTSSISGARIYVNGGSKSLTPVKKTLTGSILNNNNVIIGDRNKNMPFIGNIDDVRIYNRVLSSSEIYSLYTTTKP